MFAQDYGLRATGAKLGYTESQTIYDIIGSVTSGVLALTAFVFFGFTMYAGLRWLTARGNEEFVEKAKSTLSAAITGLIVTLVAYALTSFIFSNLQTAPNSPVVNQNTTTGGAGATNSVSGSCSNDKQDGTETDVDCGGSCSPCGSTGQRCLQNKDCALGPCVNGACTASGPSCNDGVKNRDETGVDCGGQYCDICQQKGAGMQCSSSSECVSGQSCLMNAGKGYQTCGGF